jgi:hypothetical protein
LPECKGVHPAHTASAVASTTIAMKTTASKSHIRHTAPPPHSRAGESQARELFAKFEEDTSCRFENA